MVKTYIRRASEDPKCNGRRYQTYYFLEFANCISRFAN